MRYITLSTLSSIVSCTYMTTRKRVHVDITRRLCALNVWLSSLLFLHCKYTDRSGVRLACSTYTKNTACQSAPSYTWRFQHTTTCTTYSIILICNISDCSISSMSVDERFRVLWTKRLNLLIRVGISAQCWDSWVQFARNTQFCTNSRAAMRDTSFGAPQLPLSRQHPAHRGRPHRKILFYSVSARASKQNKTGRSRVRLA